MLTGRRDRAYQIVRVELRRVRESEDYRPRDAQIVVHRHDDRIGQRAGVEGDAFIGRDRLIRKPRAA
jgi:hypothetical protein